MADKNISWRSEIPTARNFVGDLEHYSCSSVAECMLSWIRLSVPFLCFKLFYFLISFYIATEVLPPTPPLGPLSLPPQSMSHPLLPTGKGSQGESTQFGTLSWDKTNPLTSVLSLSMVSPQREWVLTSRAISNEREGKLLFGVPSFDSRDPQCHSVKTKV